MKLKDTILFSPDEHVLKVHFLILEQQGVIYAAKLKRLRDLKRKLISLSAFTATAILLIHNGAIPNIGEMTALNSIITVLFIVAGLSAWVGFFSHTILKGGFSASKVRDDYAKLLAQHADEHPNQAISELAIKIADQKDQDIQKINAKNAQLGSFANRCIMAVIIVFIYISLSWSIYWIDSFIVPIVIILFYDMVFQACKDVLIMLNDVITVLKSAPEIIRKDITWVKGKLSTIQQTLSGKKPKGKT